MDTLLTIASRREEREYTDREIPEEVIERILMAARATGSARNRQPCRFTLLVKNHKLVPSVTELVTRPTNVSGAALLILVTVNDPKALFDAGRACQNMMLAAWAEGVGSCPNSLKDPVPLKSILDVPAGEEPVTILSFGWPARERLLEARSPQAWVKRLDRLPVDEVIRRL